MQNSNSWRDMSVLQINLNLLFFCSFYLVLNQLYMILLIAYSIISIVLFILNSLFDWI